MYTYLRPSPLLWRCVLNIWLQFNYLWHPRLCLGPRICSLRKEDPDTPSLLSWIIEECVGKSIWGLKWYPAPSEDMGTGFCLRTGLGIILLSIMVNHSARASSGGQRESFCRWKQVSRYNKGIWCVGNSSTQSMGLALEIGEEARQNSSTAHLSGSPRLCPLSAGDTTTAQEGHGW